MAGQVTLPGAAGAPEKPLPFEPLPTGIDTLLPGDCTFRGYADAASINSAWRRRALQAMHAVAEQEHVRTIMKAPQAIRRLISNAWATGPLVLLLAFVVGTPASIGVLRARIMDPDPDGADALLMGAIIWVVRSVFRAGSDWFGHSCDVPFCEMAWGKSS
jgi:hypothetical protein